MEIKEIVKELKDIELRCTEPHIKKRLMKLWADLEEPRESLSGDFLPEGPSEDDILEKLKKIEEEVKI